MEHRLAEAEAAKDNDEPMTPTPKHKQDLVEPASTDKVNMAKREYPKVPDFHDETAASVKKAKLGS